MKEKEVRINFTQYNPDDEIIELDFNYPDEAMTMATFHDYCKRFALAVGYSEKLVEKYFGPTQYDI